MPPPVKRTFYQIAKDENTDVPAMTMSFEDPRVKLVTGESGSLANEPCDPVGQADWGREERGKAILALYLLHQLDEPSMGRTRTGEQKRFAEKSCQY